MLKLKLFFAVFLSFVFFQTANAADIKQEFQQYINDRITDVKEAEDPAEKREILNEMFDDLTSALDYAKNSPLISDEDLPGINYLQNKVSERYNELNGLNGFEKVSDSNLNEFANYTLQDIEQADTILTISLTTLLLIIILAILIF